MRPYSMKRKAKEKQARDLTTGETLSSYPITGSLMDCKCEHGCTRQRLRSEETCWDCHADTCQCLVCGDCSCCCSCSVQTFKLQFSKPASFEIKEGANVSTQTTVTITNASSQTTVTVAPDAHVVTTHIKRENGKTTVQTGGDGPGRSIQPSSSRDIARFARDVADRLAKGVGTEPEVCCGPGCGCGWEGPT